MGYFPVRPISNRPQEDELLDDAGGIKTKYGRKVHAPQQFQPSSGIPFVCLGPFLTTGSTRKRRQPDETHFCQICTRSAGPEQNRLVFCDNCDTPYHQMCHDPPILDATVDSNNQWFCGSCKPPQVAEGFSQRLSGQGMSTVQVMTRMIYTDLRSGLHYNNSPKIN
jgi:PHD-finger